MTNDSLSVLSSPRVQAAKGRPIRLGYWLKYDEIPLTSFDDLTAALTGLAPLPQTYVIRGRKIVDCAVIRRRFKHEPFHLGASPRQWLCVDVDAAPIPGALTNPVAAVTAARALLPDGLATAQCYYAITGSATDELLHTHLWFWLDRPYADAEIITALIGIKCVDNSLYKPTQPHFTALPVIDGDPLAGRRRGILTGECARLGSPRQVNATAAWIAIEHNLTTIARKKKGERHVAINASAYHLAEHVASGAVARNDLEAVLIDAATIAGLSQERAVDEIGRALDDGIAAAANAPAWLDKIARTKEGSARSNHANAIIALSLSPEWAGALVFNTRDNCGEWAKGPPLSTYDSAKAGRPLLDEHAAIMVQWVAEHGMSLTLGGALECMLAVARMSEYDPLRDRMDTLDWDGSARLDTWLSRYLGAEDTSYTRAVGRKWLISAIARLYNPGCKADYCLVLEGKRGIKKSQALDILGLGYTRDIRVDVRDVDAVDALHRSTWIAHLPELEALKRGKDIEAVKAYLTQRIDHFREKYARVTRTYKRGMVFAATTNESDYIVDSTGNRQYWPVLCITVDIPALAADVEQLWAEALMAYRDGEQWWLEDELMAQDEQIARLALDPWEDELVIALKGIDRVSTRDCLEKHLDIPVERRTPYHAQRLGRVLKRLGWERVSTRGADGRREWRYERKK